MFSCIALLTFVQSNEEEFQLESLNDEEVVSPESIPPPALAPIGEKELTDEDYDKLAKAKEAATEALEVSTTQGSA